MEYEYEGLVISTVYDLNSEMYPDKEIEIIKSELKEVYAKAKAFDEIKKLRNSYYIYSKTNSGTPIKVIDAKPFGREVSHLINKKGYMEDK